MSTQEQRARAYCQSIGADPDQIVGGYPPPDSAGWVMAKQWVKAPRWRWYVGAVIQQQHAAE